MKLVASIFLLAAIGCSSVDSKKVPTVVQDGSDYAHAVVIKAESSEEGIKQERMWLDEHIAGYHFCDGSVEKLPNGDEVMSLTHATDAKDGRIFSIFCVRPPNGSHRSAYFDITSFFGKDLKPNKTPQTTTGSSAPRRV